LVFSPRYEKNAVSFDKSIELRDIGYESGESHLHIDSLLFEKGKKYAIIVTSGSGKTTLLKILMGHIKDFKGFVEFDGIDAEDFDVPKVINEITQNEYIFNGSAIDNITLFGSFPDDKIHELAKELKAENILREDLGEYGKNISGGERNKIAILRVVNRDQTF
jgi:ABC-type bacteriocin/lantibiotic exporter with double-glycine peptidase domain